ncbi:MAG: hypothetical protein NUV49_01730 [Patescibacteria group bacterium]|nr:hypothetical protein [Patescibacteria group bacterium]
MKSPKHKNTREYFLGSVFPYSRKKGYITLLVMVFSTVFVTIVFGLAGFVFVQNKVSIAKEDRERAIQIAEAGLDYYKWFLAHNPGDLTDGTGTSGPYEHTYSDPEGGVIGTFSLEVDGNLKCGDVTSIDITSTGWTTDNSALKRKVFGKYAQPSVAEYAYILNSSVWAGSDRTITGRYHSNGGIRMDGINQSSVTSAVESWLCTSSFGCSPSATQDGVFGDGAGSNLWEFPVEPVDFVGITQNLVNMKTKAQANGLYFGPVGGESNKRGYHAIFRVNGTLDVYQVTNTSYVWGYNSDTGWEREYNTITSENLLGNYTIPAGCALAFFEDKLWLEGTVNSKVTVVAADVSQPNYDPDIIINGNITYATLDGTNGLTAVAEHSILVPLVSPDNMVIRGVLVAQNGNFGRNYYTSSGSYRVPSSLNSYILRNSLTMNGSIVSNGRVGTRWSCGGAYCSGYATRYNSYDRQLASDPPPLTPFVDDEYTFIEWREEQ